MVFYNILHLAKNKTVDKMSNKIKIIKYVKTERYVSYILCHEIVKLKVRVVCKIIYIIIQKLK